MAIEESKARHLPFLTAQARINSRYGLDINRDDFIETAYYIWRDLGNIATRDSSFNATVPGDGVIELPSDCEFIYGVTSEAYNPNTTQFTSYGKNRYDSKGKRPEHNSDQNTLSAPSSIRTPRQYAFGISVDYELGTDWIKIKSPMLVGRTVYIQYNSIDVDGDGLPMLNDKEVEAISTNVALQEMEKKMFRGGLGKEHANSLQYLKMEADRTFQAAKIPEKISDEAIDRALDAKTSWNRKSYGIRFNPIT